MRSVRTAVLVFVMGSAAFGQTPAASAIQDGRKALAARDFSLAKSIFWETLRSTPQSVDALVGEGDAELGLHEYEAAELTYRKATMLQPELWLAHKNLVIVEAALGRWEEFDRERALLHAARMRGAKGIGWHENDVIDTIHVGTARWIVRAYDEPPGTLQTRYNFERFASDGRVQEYVSLEPVKDQSSAAATAFALNFYTGKTHGTVLRYGDGEPTYQRVRTDVLRWLRSPRR